MEKEINFFDTKGNKITAELIFALTVPSLSKTFVAINNSDIIFNEQSSYNNLDILELVKEERKLFLY